MRRRHPKTQTVRAKPFDILPGAEEKRPRVNLTTAGPALFFGPAKHIQTFWRGHMHDVEFVSDRLLKPKECRNCRVPDYPVKIAIGFRVCLWTVIARFPISAFDFVHQILIVRMNHQWQPGLANLFERTKQIAM